MILVIDNLGIIKQARIDLSKEIILFCGRNSTGKTYASYVLQAFLDNDGVFTSPCFNSVLNQIQECGHFIIEKSIIEEWLNAKCEMLKSQIGSIFGISDATCDKLFQKFNIRVEYSDEDFQKTLGLCINETKKEGGLLWKTTKVLDSDIVCLESNSKETLFSSLGSVRTVSILSNIMHHLAFGKNAGVRMLTVERNSIYTFKTELSLSRNELIDHIQQSDRSEIDIFELLNKSSRRYPQAVRSSLRIANDLENVQKYDSPFSAFADMIEQRLLKGEVNMTKNGDVEFHAEHMPKTRRLPFHMSSSIVKTMASLVIYLRHIAQIGDTLIIDEPEMNFHPDVQVQLAKIFAILASNGLHLVVSTHSDYIIREINNLIMASSISKSDSSSDISEFGYTNEMLLDCDNISVMFFERTSKTAVSVKPINVDRYGFSIDSIDKTIEEQNMIAENLYAILKK